MDSHNTIISNHPWHITELHTRHLANLDIIVLTAPSGEWFGKYTALWWVNWEIRNPILKDVFIMYNMTTATAAMPTNGPSQGQTIFCVSCKRSVKNNNYSCHCQCKMNLKKELNKNLFQEWMVKNPDKDYKEYVFCNACQKDIRLHMKITMINWKCITRTGRGRALYL